MKFHVITIPLPFKVSDDKSLCTGKIQNKD